MERWFAGRTMWDQVVRFCSLAHDCKDRAIEARDPVDADAWAKLAAEWLALASASLTSEVRHDARNASGRSASE